MAEFQPFGPAELAWRCPVDSYRVWGLLNPPAELDGDPHALALWRASRDENLEGMVEAHEAVHHGIPAA